MKVKLRFILILTFIISSIITTIQFNTHRPRLLILHSYGSETEQARNINRGLRDVLRSKTYFSIRWYYSGLHTMTSKNMAESEALRVRKLISTWKPDIILAVGYDAQKYVAHHYINDPKIKLVYCAAHEEAEHYGLNHATNTTGTLMIPPLDTLRDMLLDLGQQLALAKPLRILHLGDKSDDVEDDGTYMATKEWGDLRFVGNKYVETFDDWKNAVRQAEKHADFILTSGYHKLSRSRTNHTWVSAHEVVAWTVAHSSIPVIGTRSQYVWDGGMLAVGASLYTQGREAGKISIKLLEQHVSPSSIPVSTPNDFVVAVNQSKLRERHIYLPDIYIALARASNNYFP